MVKTILPHKHHWLLTSFMLALVVAWGLFPTRASTVHAASTYSISGQVTLGGGSISGKGATHIFATGPSSGSAVTGGTGGNYMIGNLAPGTYSVRVQVPAGYLAIGGAIRTVKLGPSNGFASFSLTAIGPSATVACNGAITSVDAIDPNEPFSATVSVVFSPDTAADTDFGPDTLSATITGPPLYGGYSHSTQTPTVANGVASMTMNVPATHASGNFTITWQVTGSQDPTTDTACTQTIPVTYLPFFTVRNGDISAGMGFGSACTTNTVADITGENMDGSNPAGNFFGAGSSQAAIATGSISHFATDTTNDMPSGSGKASDGLSVNQPSGLAFANSPLTAGEYGENALGSSTQSWCVPDYYSAGGTAAGAFDPANIQSGTYTLTTPTIGNLTIPAGVNVIVKAVGNVYINGNITYAGYTSLAQVPQFRLVVSGGNLYIDSHVNEIHGFYVSQPDSTNTGGTTFTCATGPGAASTDYATCNHALTIYGSVSANQIILGRMAGDIAGATTYEAAEDIVYTPELWLGASSDCTNSSANPNCLFQSYTSLPPIL